MGNDELYDYILGLDVAGSLQMMVGIIAIALVSITILYMTAYAVKQAIVFFKDITKP